jgi:OOP family OmpA-OmpF porin
MRILIAGFAGFVVWCVFSAWIYNDKLWPVINASEPILAVPEKSAVAETPENPLADIPKTLSIYFEFDKAKFKSDQQTDSQIARFREWLGKYPEAKLSVTGHTDMVGTDAYNQDLALKRAIVAEKYIETLGITGERMLVESKGETEPAADNLTSEGRAKNRRTEIKIKME